MQTLGLNLLDMTISDVITLVGTTCPAIVQIECCSIYYIPFEHASFNLLQVLMVTPRQGVCNSTSNVTLTREGCRT